MKKLKPTKNSDGYLRVTLYNEHGRTSKTIHRILGEEFIPNPENLAEVDHIDRNKLNNDLLNLRWVTQEDNKRNVDLGVKAARLAKTYQLTNPDGSIDIVHNLTNHARRLGAAPQHLSRVANGLRPHYKGIKIEVLKWAE